MTNLATCNTSDYTITPTGEAYISQVKLAELCGVSKQSISRFIGKLVNSTNINKFNEIGDNSADNLETCLLPKFNKLNQVRSDFVELVIGYYAFDSLRTNETALANYRILPTGQQELSETIVNYFR